MKKDIILAGVGGQGILTIAAVIGTAALEMGLNLKQAEVHGMSQRGGDVQSNLRLSSGRIYSDLIPRGEADIVISMEPMEGLRYLPWLRPGGTIVCNTVPFVNIDNYPEAEKIEKAYADGGFSTVMLDADAMAREAGSPRSSNIVLLGAAAPFLDIDADRLRRALDTCFGAKGEAVLEANRKAFEAGLQFAKA